MKDDGSGTGAIPNPLKPPIADGFELTVTKRSLGSVNPSVSPVEIPSFKAMFCPSVLTPLPDHSVPGSFPGVPMVPLLPWMNR